MQHRRRSLCAQFRVHVCALACASLLRCERSADKSSESASTDTTETAPDAATVSDGDASVELTEAGLAPTPPDDGFIRLTELPDEDPTPGRVQVSLSALEQEIAIIDGRKNPQRSYNGTIPGPLIRARRGDVLTVRFKNELSEGTTIHWHGMRVPNGMDGVPGVTQDIVEPGGSFVYEYPLLDEGTFWYHPHFETPKQLGDGLYGAVLVEDPNEEEHLGRETVMAISDISLFEDGSVQHHPETDETRILGREGATLLLNGHPNQRMRIASGTRLRWRLMNMARSRYLELALPGHTFLRIGSDGGRLEYPVEEEFVKLTPGERVDVIVEPKGEPNTHLNLVTLPVDRGPEASTAVGPEILLRVEFTEEDAVVAPSLGRLERDKEVFPLEGAEEVTVELTMETVDGVLEMGINGVPFTESQPCPRRPARLPGRNM